jgi:toxin ParE1/3/4
MTGGYVLSHEASLDLAEIEDYAARRWGDDQAEKYLRDIFDAFEGLAKNPDLGRSRADVPSPYLVYSVGSHLIVYRYRQPADRVEVLNVLHPAMDIGARLRKALARAVKRRQG